jgi:hypothetical protein
MLIDDLKTLPEEVQDFIWETISDINYEIFDKFSFDFAQFNFFNGLEDDIILKKKNAIDLPKELEKMPGEFSGDFRDLALQMAKEIFWPLQEYLGQVDRLILRLGGKVPRAVALKKKRKVGANQLSELFKGKVKELIDTHKEFKNLRLTPNKIFNKKGLKVSPSVKNWIEDYIHFLGAGEHSSIQRAKYISKSTNALGLADKYKDSLRFLLLSYDQGTEIYFDTSERLLSIKEHEEKENIEQKSETQQLNFDKLLIDFKKDLDSLQDKLLSNSFIMSEANDDINKVRDLLWKAIGIGDKEKAISCLGILIEKQSFDAMIKEDSRFKSILKRFIGIKYGQSMEKSLETNTDKLIIRRIFLEMVLADKLNLSEQKLFAVVFYLTNILPNSGQLIYFDRKERQFEWRTIQVNANHFVWIDKV